MNLPTTRRNGLRRLVSASVLAILALGLTGSVAGRDRAFGQAVSNAKMHGVAADSTGALVATPPSGQRRPSRGRPPPR